MNIKEVTYTGLDGVPYTVEYDADALCWYCGLPVKEASMGGTVVCPWCDCGAHRNGIKWTITEAFQMYKNFNENSKKNGNL